MDSICGRHHSLPRLELAVAKRDSVDARPVEEQLSLSEGEKLKLSVLRG